MGLNKTLYEYQQKASDEIQKHWKETLEFLASPFGDKVKDSDRKKVLAAATGAGKTMIVSDVLVQTAADWKAEGKETVFFVMAPNSLNKQLQADMISNGVSNDGILNPVSIQDVANGHKISPWDIVYTNYSSVDKEKNTVIVENERGTDLLTQMDKLRQDNIRVILVVDEGHVNYSGKKAQPFIENVLQPDLTLLVTATPHEGIKGYDPSDESQTVRVSKEEAIRSGALVNKVIINKGIDEVSTDEEDAGYKVANLKFVDMAIAMKERMDKAYSDEGANVRCLIGIQIPSKTKNIFEISESHGERRKDNTEEKQMLDYVLEHLEERNPDWFVTKTEDGKGSVDDKVAIWLAEQKTHNVSDDIIKPNDSHVDVIVFKEAIAVGWDCPRLGSGALLRDSKTKPFVAQTGGRFMRMPEQKHYDSEILNYGYIFTAHALIKKVLESKDDANMSLAPKEVKLDDDDSITSIVNALKDMGGLPYDHRQRNNDPVISKENIRKASREFLKEQDIEPAQMGGGISFSDWKKLGVDTDAKVSGMTVLNEQELKVDEPLNQDYETTQSKIRLQDVDKENQYRKIIQSSASHGNLKMVQTARNMMKHINSHMLPCSIVDGSKYNERDFIDVVIANEDNIMAFQWVINQILEKADALQGGSGRPDTIQRRQSNWFIPNVLLIEHDNVECKNCALDVKDVRPAVSEALHECIDKNPTSNPEKMYLNRVPEKIRDTLNKKHGGHVIHGYMKNGEQGSHFGIKYTDNNGDHIFYPDFFHFFLINGKLHISIVEVKEKGSGKGDTIETIRAKSQALEDYCHSMREDGVSVHGHIWAFGKHGSSSEDEVDYHSW